MRILSVLLTVLFSTVSFAQTALLDRPQLTPRNQQDFNFLDFKKDALKYIGELKNSPSVRIDKASPPSDSVLLYMAMILKIIPVNAIIYLHGTQTTSPQLVTSQESADGLHLYFSANADQHVYTKKLAEIYLNVVKEFGSESAAAKALNAGRLYDLNYDNTLLKQLLPLITNINSITALTEDLFGIKLSIPRNDPSYQTHGRFSFPESVTLFVQLMELPENVRKKMHLKFFIRVPPLEDINHAAGDYNPNSGVIRISDSAFSFSRAEGGIESVMLHELGHAYWFGAMSEADRKDYASLSWMKTAEGKWTINPEKMNFISTYSRGGTSGNDMAEDFPEHFAFYVNNSKRLRVLTEDKYLFLQKKVFGVTFVNYGADQSTVALKNSKEDRKAPEIRNISPSTVTASCTSYEEGRCNLHITINGIFDDISGIDYVSALFSGRNGDSFRVDLTESKKTDVPGQYVDDQKLWFTPPNDQPYCVNAILTGDKAENRSITWKDTKWPNINMGCFTLKGQNSLGKSAKDEDEKKQKKPLADFKTEEARAQKETKISVFDQTDTLIGLDLRFPIRHSELFERLALVFFPEKQERIDQWIEAKNFISQVGDDHVSVRMWIPRSAFAENVSLVTAAFVQKETATHASTQNAVFFKKPIRVPVPVISRDELAKRGTPQLLSELHKLELKEQDGNKSLVATVPVRRKDVAGVKSEELYVYVHQPNGNIDYKSSYHSSGSSVKQGETFDSDLAEFKVEMPLSTYAGSGDYYVTELLYRRCFAAPGSKDSWERACETQNLQIENRGVQQKVNVTSGPKQAPLKNKR